MVMAARPRATIYGTFSVPGRKPPSCPAQVEGAAQPDREQNSFTIGRYEFDYERQLLQRDAKKQKLTTREADLLKLLCLHVNATLPRDVALKTIWGSDSHFNGRSMDVFISRLRSYLRNDSSIEIINVHGVGYKLVVG